MYLSSTTKPSNNGHLASALLNEEPISTSSRVIKLDAGQNLYVEGDDAELVYEVVEGVIRTSKLLSDGRRQILNFGYPGDVIGLSHDDAFHCDCDAVTKARIRVYRRPFANSSYHANPQLYDKMLKQATSEVRYMQEHFLMLGRKTALEKVASFLSTLQNRVGNDIEGRINFTLPMTRADIADFLGLTIETVSRSITKLRKMGVIELPTPHDVYVCKPSQLRGLGEHERTYLM